jgi:hypothetical protein
MRHERPCLHVDPSTVNTFQAAKDISAWIVQHQIEILNVAGPRSSEDAEIYKLTVKILKAVFYLNLIDENIPGSPFISARTQTERKDKGAFMPRSVEEAVSRLISGLSLKDKTKIAYMRGEDLTFIYPSLGEYIQDRYGLPDGNSALMESCRSLSKAKELREERAFAVIIHELWEKLRKSHVLRPVE